MQNLLDYNIFNIISSILLFLATFKLIFSFHINMLYLSLWLSLSSFSISVYLSPPLLPLSFFLYIYIYIYLSVSLSLSLSLSLYIYTNPFTQRGWDIRSIFNGSLTGSNSQFSFSLTRCHTNVEDSSLPIAGGRTIGFIPFLRVFVQCEIQTASFRIWTRVAVFITMTITITSPTPIASPSLSLCFSLFLTHPLLSLRIYK